MDYALIGYPLSDRYRDKLEATAGTAPQYLSLPELRRLSIPTLLKTITGLNANRLFIAMESPGSRPLLPVFYCLAGMSRARSIHVVYPDLRMETVSRFKTIKSLFSVLGASAGGRASLWRCRGELNALLKQPRIELPPPSGPGSVLYLKSNLWMGVKAGGSVGHVAGVANALIQAGYPVEFAGAEAPLLVENANVHVVPPAENYGYPFEVNLYRYQEKFTRAATKIHPAGNPFAFIYQRMSVSNYSGVQISRQHKLPLVLEYNGSEVWAAENWGKKANFHETAVKAEEVCLKHAHLIVTVSDVLRDELVDRGVPKERVLSYPNCIDPKTYDPALFTADRIASVRHKFNIPKDGVVAGFVGTFGQWHGVDILAQAIRQMAIEQPEWLQKNKVHFLIVGDGLLMPQVRETLSDPRCAPFYTLTGLVPQAETPLYMAATDILLSPHVNNADGSRFFGSPTKLFEYMALEKPIVASDLEQIGEVLRGGLQASSLPKDEPTGPRSELAVLCKPSDVADLCRGIEFLVEHPGWRKELGRAARQEALAKYTWDQNVNAVLAQLARV